MEEVVIALGGKDAVMALFPGIRRTHIANWLRAGKFPAHTYPVMKRALDRLNFVAPDSLWATKKYGRTAKDAE